MQSDPFFSNLPPSSSANYGAFHAPLPLYIKTGVQGKGFELAVYSEHSVYFRQVFQFLLFSLLLLFLLFLIGNRLSTLFIFTFAQSFSLC